MKLVFSALLILTLSACSSRPFLPDAPLDSQRHQQQLSRLTEWQIDGRMAYQDKQEKHSASFSWTQRQENFELDLRTFIGTSILQLQQYPTQASLDIDDQHYVADNAEELLDRLTGWHIPVHQLNRWIKGQATGIEQLQYAPSGWLTRLQHQGWTVTYANYQPVNQYLLPHDVRLQKQHRQIKLRINQWQLK